MLYSFFMEQKRFFVIGVLFYAAVNVSAGSLTTLLNRPEKDYPLSHTVVRKKTGESKLALLPNIPGSEIINRRFHNYNPEFTLERLYRIALPQRYSGDTSKSRRILFTDIVNILGKPGSQVGYTYHSSRKNADVVLFENLYISDRKGKRIPGFQYTAATLPAVFSYYQYVDEANFPGTVFEQKISITDSYLSYQSINSKTIRLFIFPVVREGGTHNEVFFFVSGKYLYMYNCTQLRKEPVLKSLGFSINMSSMFRKRMDVMARWMEDRLTGK